MLYIHFLLSLRNVKDLLNKRSVNVSHETDRCRLCVLGPLFAFEFRMRRVGATRYRFWRWHLAEVFAKINGEKHYLSRVVDHPMVLRHTALVWISVASASNGIRTSSLR